MIMTQLVNSIMPHFIPGKSSHHSGPLSAPVVAGVEGVMEVLAVGSNVSEHRVGDWVCVFKPHNLLRHSPITTLFGPRSDS